MKISNAVRALCLILIVSFSHLTLSGCAAGNYGFVRSVAKWNLKMSILPRVLIYILFIIIPVYPIAILIDMLVGNTIEFWTGSPIIQASNKTFEKDGNTVQVVHERNPLRKTTMTSTDKDGKVSVTQILETERKTIEVFVDGVKKAEVNDIHEVFPKLVTYNNEGTRALSRTTIDTSQFDDLKNQSTAAGLFAARAFLESKSGSALVCSR